MEKKNSLINKCSHEEKIEYFCQSCNIYLCENCKTDKHRGHQCIKYHLKISILKEEIENIINDYLPLKNSFDEIYIYEEKFLKMLDKSFYQLIIKLKNYHETLKIKIIENLKFRELFENQKKFDLDIIDLKTNFEELQKDEICENKSKSFEIIEKINMEGKSGNVIAMTNRELMKNPVPIQGTSKIINSFNEIDFVINEIDVKLGKQLDFKLLFKASEHQFSAAKFYSICEGIKPFLLLVETTTNKKFGAYANAAFVNTKQWKSFKDSSAFIFSIDKKEIIPIKADKAMNAIGCHSDYGPCIGFNTTDIWIADNCDKNDNSHTGYFGYNYELPSDIQYNSVEAKSYLHGNNGGHFKVLEYEIWKIE